MSDWDKVRQFFSDAFYREEKIILDEFRHVQTPTHIIRGIGNIDEIAKERNYNSNPFAFSFKSDEIQFVKDSLKNNMHWNEECERKPFHGYYCTFSDMNEEQKKWYFYWRERVLNGEYLYTDLSYIYVFVYELLNYTFNLSAAFNISMLLRLYEGYKTYYKLERFTYLISDMLFEAGEEELANKWNPHKEDIPVLYEQLRGKEGHELSRVSINDWKNYLQNNRKSIYFKQNRNKVYKTFKECIHLLDEVYQKENKRMIDVFFESKIVMRKRYLYSGMVVFREGEQSIGFETEVFIPTKRLVEDISNFYRLCENVTRLLNDEKRQLPMEDNTLPEELKDMMLDYLQKPKEKGRFKTVQKGNGTAKGSSIPKPPEERKPVIIEFDDERIKQLQEETDSLVEEVEKRTVETEFEEQIENEEVASLMEEVVSVEEETVTNSLETFFAFGGDEANEEEMEEFIDELSDMEKEFLRQFQGLEYKKQEANAYIKKKGSMLGVVLQSINEKALETLEDVLIEEEEDVLSIVEEFKGVLHMIKEGN